jgi:hypothetical protein
MRVAFFRLMFLLYAISSLAVPMALWAKHQDAMSSFDSMRAVPWQPDLDSAAEQISISNEDKVKVFDMTAMLERPLMSQTRKPFAPQPVAVVQEVPVQSQEIVQPPPAPPSVDGFRLMGLLFDSRTQKALISTPSQPLGVWVALNEQLENFLIISIERNGVTLEQQGQRITLEQYVDKQN